MRTCLLAIVALTVSLAASRTWAADPAVPAGLFKELNDEAQGGAVLLEGKQLFIDDFLIERIDGAQKVLNQPVKHPGNPILVRDRPWEESGPGYGSVLYDRDERLFKMWYSFWRKVKEGEVSVARLAYATSKDGITWVKPAVNASDGSNLVTAPAVGGFQCAGVFRDPAERDPRKRYKMLFSANPDGSAMGWLSSAAWSGDGMAWQAADDLRLIPFSDTQLCPFWDARRNRYVAFLRFGPPNTRIVSRIESEDFLNWSPKVTVLDQVAVDGPLNTQFYQAAMMPYEGVYVGLIAAYHNEILKPARPEEPWTDRKNLQLVYSRNGVTWSRVGKHGAIAQGELKREQDWKADALDMVFLPYGEKDKDWDWGTVSPYYTPAPLIVGDEIRIYYVAQNGRNWWTYRGDPPQFQPDEQPPTLGVGMASLRLDGFVSVDAEGEGTLTTKAFVFLGDTLEINANAGGGSLRVEALDGAGKLIEGFSRGDCLPITSDSVRHELKWKGQANSGLLQARPIKLRFHLTRAKLYSFTPRTRHQHFVPSG